MESNKNTLHFLMQIENAPPKPTSKNVSFLSRNLNFFLVWAFIVYCKIWFQIHLLLFELGYLYSFFSLLQKFNSSNVHINTPGHLSGHLSGVSFYVHLVSHFMFVWRLTLCLSGVSLYVYLNSKARGKHLIIYLWWTIAKHFSHVSDLPIWW